MGLLILYLLNYLITPSVVGIIRLESLFRPRGQDQFDSEKWKKAIPGGGERYRMVDKLLEKQLSIGMSLPEVKTLLGKAEIEASQRTNEVELHYTIGSQKQFPAKSFFFPYRLGNSEVWVLLLYFQGGRLVSIEVRPS